MSKKKPKNSSNKPIPEPPPPTTALSSFRSLWRRNGLFLAIGMFVLANITLLAMDAGRISQTAFGMISVLTILSILLAITYGLQYLQTKRRADLENWDSQKWQRWRDGHG
ncbi:MAG: hypothetical protein ACK41E_02515 [Deinococcales bacterium]